MFLGITILLKHIFQPVQGKSCPKIVISSENKGTCSPLATGGKRD